MRAAAACKENSLRKVSYSAFPRRRHVLPEIKEEKKRCSPGRRGVCKQRCRDGWGGHGNSTGRGDRDGRRMHCVR